MSEEITRLIIQQMRAQGNQPGLIRIFKREMGLWAGKHKNTRDGEALLQWLPLMPERPVYTARELVPLFPAMALALGLTRRLQPQKSTLRLARELEFHNLPKLQNANGRDTFKHPVANYDDNFFIVECVHKWRDIVLTQREFERYFFND